MSKTEIVVTSGDIVQVVGVQVARQLALSIHAENVFEYGLSTTPEKDAEAVSKIASDISLGAHVAKSGLGMLLMFVARCDDLPADLTGFVRLTNDDIVAIEDVIRAQARALSHLHVNWQLED